MALLFIKGQEEPIHFDDKHFEMVNELFTDYLEGRGDGAVRLPDQTIRSSQIKRVQRERREAADVALEVEEVKAFEKELEAYCAAATAALPPVPPGTEHDLSHWGKDTHWRRIRIARERAALQKPPEAPSSSEVPNVASVADKLPQIAPQGAEEAERPRSPYLDPIFTVNNNILGLVHFGIVKYCEEKQILIHSGEMYGWSIFDHGADKAVITPYIEFNRKFEAVRDLRRRRLYAKEKEAEELAQGTGVASETLREPEQIPF